MKSSSLQSGDQKPTRPKYDPRVERRHGSLLDSLARIMGYAPAAIQRKADVSGLTAGRTLGDSIAVFRDDENTLLHELGHFWSAKENLASLDAADSMRVDPQSVRGTERLANAYAALLRARNDTTQTRSKDAKLLYRIMARLKAQDAKRQ